MLPLLTLNSSNIGAPFPQTKIRFLVEFDPQTQRKLEDGTVVGPGATLTILSNLDEMSDSLSAAAMRMSQWVAAGLVADAGEGSTLDSNGGLFWSISWTEFNESIKIHTCPTANAPSAGPAAPYILTDYRQTMIDENGHQQIIFEFSVYTEDLDRLVFNKYE